MPASAPAPAMRPDSDSHGDGTRCPPFGAPVRESARSEQRPLPLHPRNRTMVREGPEGYAQAAQCFRGRTRQARHAFRPPQAAPLGFEGLHPLQ